MGNLHKSLELVQLGEQSAVGTGVAATWQLSVPVEFNDSSVVETPASMTGRAMANMGNIRQAVEKSTGVTIPQTPITAEDLKTLLHFALGVTPDTDGSEVEATDVLFAHAWDWQYDAIPSVLGATLEHHTSDGSTATVRDYQDFFITNFTLTWGRGQFVQFGATGIAQAGASGSLTDLSTPFPHADLAYFPSSRGNIHFDDAMSGLGGTAYPGEMLSGTLSVDTGLVALRASDANTDLHYGDIVFDSSLRKATLEATVLATASGSDIWQGERGHAEAEDLRAVLLRFLGPPAATGSTARRLQFGMAMRHTPNTYIPSATEDGQMVVNLSMETHPDPADASFLVATVHSSDEDNAPSAT